MSNQRTRDPTWFRSVAFMARPGDWPLYPFLPLARGPEEEPELGVLFDALGVLDLAGYRCTVFLSNVHHIPPRLEALLALPRETFDTFEELADAGWRVN